MPNIIGLGGIFFKAKDPEKLKIWYKEHLGISGEYGIMFNWKEQAEKQGNAYTVFSTFKEDTDYFSPSAKPFMFNFVVDDLAGMLAKLKSEGVEVLGEMEEYDYGKFGRIVDPEGNKIELWEATKE
jgi:predicted enzyme related to lactoylglutathione lyase